MSTHWTEFSENPNELSLRLARAKLIQAATRTGVVDRIGRICELAKDLSVLDIGCVSHEASAEGEGEWLHRRVAEVAGACLGIDILSDAIGILQEKGYSVEVHDISASPLERGFDLIVCGEIIEHLSNHGSFFINCGRSLGEGGRLVVSTPYPWFLGTMLRNLFKGKQLPGSMDHVAWYDPSTVAEIADRHGFAVEEIAGIEPLQSETGRGPQELIYRWIRKRRVPFISPLVGCRSLFYVLRKVGE